MADNIYVSPATEPNKVLVSTNDISNVHYPVYKIGYGVSGSIDLVSKTSPLPVAMAADQSTHDAFARLRISHPETLFDSKQIHNNAPLFFDDQQVSGTGTTSTWSQSPTPS